MSDFPRYAIWRTPTNPRYFTPGKVSDTTIGPEIFTNAQRSLWPSGTRQFPSAVDELLKLPGIGRYTAGAIASFAFDLPAPIVDANIARAVSRLLNLQEPVDQAARKSDHLGFCVSICAGPPIPRLLNSALMELGATICLPRKPLCVICPVRSFCRARDPESLPRKRERQKIEKKTEFHFLALKEGRILLQQNPGKRWHGLWTLPVLAPGSESSQHFDVNHPFLSLSYPITRFVVRLNVFLSEPPATLSAGQAWHGLELLDSVPMPSPHRRAVRDGAREEADRRSGVIAVRRHKETETSGRHTDRRLDSLDSSRRERRWSCYPSMHSHS